MKLNIRELKARGCAVAEENRFATRRLVLLYCGVIAALSLVVPALDLFLSEQISSTGGLSGMNLRTILQTAREILNLFNRFFGPFWSAGFVFAMMAMVRGREPQTGDLTMGLRKGFRVLGHIAFEFLLVVALVVASGYLAALIIALTPLGTELSDLLGPYVSDPSFLTSEGTLNLELIPMDVLTAALIPVSIVTVVLFLPAYIWLSYGYRLSLYLLLDGAAPSAVQARFMSQRLMKGHKWSMMKLDLSWWWYYLLVAVITAVGYLVAVITAVGYLDLILAMANIPLPMDETVMFFGTIAVYCVLISALSLWKKSQVEAGYALAYDAIVHPENEEVSPEIA